MARMASIYVAVALMVAAAAVSASSGYDAHPEAFKDAIFSGPRVKLAIDHMYNVKDPFCPAGTPQVDFTDGDAPLPTAVHDMNPGFYDAEEKGRCMNYCWYVTQTGTCGEGYWTCSSDDTSPHPPGTWSEADFCPLEGSCKYKRCEKEGDLSDYTDYGSGRQYEMLYDGVHAVDDTWDGEGGCVNTGVADTAEQALDACKAACDEQPEVCNGFYVYSKASAERGRCCLKTAWAATGTRPAPLGEFWRLIPAEPEELRHDTLPLILLTAQPGVVAVSNDFHPQWRGRSGEGTNAAKLLDSNTDWSPRSAIHFSDWVYIDFGDVKTVQSATLFQLGEFDNGHNYGNTGFAWQILQKDASDLNDEGNWESVSGPDQNDYCDSPGDKCHIVQFTFPPLKCETRAIRIKKTTYQYNQDFMRAEEVIVMGYDGLLKERPEPVLTPPAPAPTEASPAPTDIPTGGARLDGTWKSQLSGDLMFITENAEGTAGEGRNDQDVLMFTFTISESHITLMFGPIELDGDLSEDGNTISFEHSPLPDVWERQGAAPTGVDFAGYQGPCFAGCATCDGPGEYDCNTCSDGSPITGDDDNDGYGKCGAPDLSALKPLWRSGYECLEYEGSSLTGTLAQCREHCASYKYLDFKARDGRTDGTHYCICSNVCTLAEYPEYDIYSNEYAGACFPGCATCDGPGEYDCNTCSDGSPITGDDDNDGFGRCEEPTQSPTSAPTSAPTTMNGLPGLVFVALDPPTGSLGVCEGDCDTDADCQSGLMCFHRGERDPAPPQCAEPVDSSNPNVRWGRDFCVPIEGGCDETIRGTNQDGYNGCQDKTVSGKTCQKWTVQTPHEHSRSPADFPGKLLGDHNYCRNPDDEPEGIWCYTTDPDTRWEYCDPIGEGCADTSEVWLLNGQHTITGCPWTGNDMTYNCNTFEAVRERCPQSCGLCPVTFSGYIQKTSKTETCDNAIPTAAECLSAVHSFNPSNTLHNNAGHNYGNSWPTGCFMRYDGTYFFNTGGVSGTPAQDGRRICIGSAAPTDALTPAPTDAPTPAPTDAPTPAPTDAPTPAPAPTDAPSALDSFSYSHNGAWPGHRAGNSQTNQMYPGSVEACAQVCLDTAGCIAFNYAEGYFKNCYTYTSISGGAHTSNKPNPAYVLTE